MNQPVDEAVDVLLQRRAEELKDDERYNSELEERTQADADNTNESLVISDSKVWNDRISLQGPLMKSIEQYMRMFARGLYNPQVSSKAKEYHDLQVGFLGTFMDQSVEMSGLVGLANVYEQWKRYSVYHATFQMDLVSAEVDDASPATPLIRAKSTVRVLIDRATLEAIFPHVLSNEELVQKLIGHTIEYDGVTEYTFNEKNQVVNQHLVLDFLSGFRKLLQDEKAASSLFNGALITEAALLGPVTVSD
ncbi:TPA: hypothetical protein N0F65_010348 [Lagenidium giganteum]|uniref:Uncharacterized protein n=1 Tax=Lagenidium giganteum TaxID=4803 RepID=A0AAV2Z7S6_9STRA|nr:TPA: hypothetical protein N0F65_010348 [Lagenidium giganteum]